MSSHSSSQLLCASIRTCASIQAFASTRLRRRGGVLFAAFAMFLLATLAPQAKASITLAQHASKDAGVTASSSLAFPAANTAGNWIGVVIRGGHSGQVFTVSDTRGNTYKQAVQFNQTLDGPNGETLAIFYAENIGGGANTVTVGESIGNNTLRFAILEYAGLATSNSIDVTAAGQGSGTSWNSGSATTTVGGDLILGEVTSADSRTYTAGSGYAIEEQVPAAPNTKLIAEDGIQAAAGVVSAGASVSSSSNGGALLAAFKAASGTPPPPSISSLSPGSGAVGTSVTINGANFGGSQGTSTVTFSGVPAGTASNWSASSITVNVPSGASSGSVLVTVGGVASNGVNFTVIPPPTITGLNPSSGPAGASVTITGTNFGGSQGSSTVTFNGVAATPTSWSATSIAVFVPTAASTGNVVVTVGGQQSNGVPFSVAPSISSVSPTSGPGGTSVTITGSGFGTTQGTSSVTIERIATSPTSWSATSIVVPVPTNGTAGTVAVVVTVGGIASNGGIFTVTPVINTLSPTSWPVGTSVTLSGTNFGAAQGSSSVTFNGVAATATSWSPTSIVVPVPTGATSGLVIVTVAGQASNGVAFTVTNPGPSITGISPPSASVGTSVTIRGSNFGASQGSSTVTFGGIVGTPTSWSAASIVVPVPPGDGGNVVVTVGGVASNGVSFNVIPNITSLSPSSGPAGTSVTISGTGFGATRGFSSVTFSGVPTVPTSWSDTSIVAPVPTATPTGNVVVTVGGFASNGVSFTVTPSPTISSLSPTVGPVGTIVTISGSHFGATQSGSRVLFNGTTATPISWSDTSIVTPVPGGASTGSVVVFLNGVTVGSNPATFTVGPPPPNITSLSPATGTVGTWVTITGTNFGANQGSSSITFGGVAATISSWTDTSIVAQVPAAAPTGGITFGVGGVGYVGSVNFTLVPNITSLTPTSGAAGQSVTIYGGGFGGTQGTSVLSFNGVSATPSSWTTNTIVAPVPAGAKTGNVFVNVGGADSDGMAFTVTTPPTKISLVQHTSKDAGTTSSSSLAFLSSNTAGNWIGVAIRGGHANQVYTVGDSRGNTYKQAVQFNQTLDAPNGETLAIFYAENIAGGANTVTVSESLANNTLRFALVEYSGVATSNSFDGANAAQSSGSPLNSGNVNTTANGDLLLAMAASANGATFTPDSGYTLEEKVPAAPNTKLILEDAIQTTFGVAAASPTLSPSANGGALLAAFKAVASGSGGSSAPNINSLTPNSGTVGTPVTIAGANFGASQGSSTVTFNGVSAGTASSWSTSSITVLVPSGASSGSVVVVAGGIASNGIPFTVTVPPPSITSLTPNSGLVGTSVTIAGANFGLSQGPSTVTFNGVSAGTASSWSASSITVVVPSGASSGSVVVTVGGAASNGVNFTVTVPPPSISSLTPNSGPVGTSVTISGAYLGASQGTSTVTFSGISAGTASSWSASSITVVVPSGANTGSVVVTVGGVASSGVTFTVTTSPAPAITSLNPSSAIAGGGAFTLTINGSNFSSSSTVLWNGSLRTTSFVSGTQLQAAISGSDLVAAGVAKVTVSNSGTASNASTFLVGASGGSNFGVIAVNQSAQDIVYDPKNQVFYLSVTGNASSNPSTISVLDPTTATITSAQPAGLNPNVLAISSDSQFLYAGIDGAASVQRFILPGLAPDISYALGSDSLGPYFALDLQVAPGAPHTTAVTLGNAGVSAEAQGGIVIYDDSSPRPTRATGIGDTFDSLQWGPDATTLYASNTEGSSFDLYALAVNASGVTLTQDFSEVFSHFGANIHFDPITGLIYSDDGHVMNPAGALPLGNFNIVGHMAVDANLNTAFFLSGGLGSAATIQSFDVTHFTPISSVTIPNATGTLSHLIRWGPNGLAFISGGTNGTGQVFLVGGNFVGPAPAFTTTPPPTSATPPTPAANAPSITSLVPSAAIAGRGSFVLTVTGSQFDPAATVQFNGGALSTTFVSSTQLQAAIPASQIANPGTATITVANPPSAGGSSSGSTFFVGVSGGTSSTGTGFALQIVSQPSKQVVFDPADQLFYLSVPNTSSLGNTIAVLDPASMQIVGEQYAGSNPNVLAISDDGQFLYAGIDGSSSVRRFTLPAVQPDINYSLGFLARTGPLVALDLQAAPGTPHTTAVSSGIAGSSPAAQGGITIFDDATPRPTIAEGFGAGGAVIYGSLQWGADATVLYAANNEDTGFDFYALSVSPNGVTLTNDYPNTFSSFANRIHFDRGTKLIYADDGHIVDPTTGLSTGNFGVSGPMIPDSTLNLAFFLTGVNAGVATIQSFDLTHFTPVSSITIPGVVGNPQRLIRWGQNGLAFNTDGGQLVLVGGNFVH